MIKFNKSYHPFLEKYENDFAHLHFKRWCFKFHHNNSLHITTKILNKTIKSEIMFYTYFICG